MATPDDLFADLVKPRQSMEQQPGDALFSDLVPQNEKPGVVMDAGKAAGAGLVKGVIGLASLPGTVEQLGRMGINYATGREAVSPEAALPTYNDIKGSVEKRTGKLYEPKTTLGKYVGTVAEFAPGMLFPGGAAATAGRRLGMRALQNVVAPGVVSEAAGQLTEGSKLEPVARVAGALTGGMLPNAIGRAISPMRIEPERARQAAVLANEGVDTSAGQVTGNKRLQFAESVSADTFGAGGRAADLQTRQAEQFTRATLKRAGIDAPRATDEVINEAFNRIGRDFDSVANVVSVPLRRINPTNGMARDEPILRRVTKIADDYEGSTSAAALNPMVRRIADDLSEMASSARNMDGRTYLTWRSQISKVARGADDATTKDALYDIVNALDNSAESYLRRNNTPGRDTSFMADRLRNARREYRNMMVIERAASGAGENAGMGLISPAAMANATKVMQGRRAYARGQGDFAELARAGQSVMTALPNSGTAPRVGVQLLGSVLGSGIGGLLGGGIPGGMAGAAVGQIAGPAILGRTVMNPMMQAYLQNQAGAALRDLPTATAMTRRTAVMPGTMAQWND